VSILKKIGSNYLYEREEFIQALHNYNKQDLAYL